MSSCACSTPNFFKRTSANLVSSICAGAQFAELRKLVVPKADGVVLEIGAGAGHNIPFLSPSNVLEHLLVEPNQQLIEDALQISRGAGIESRFVCARAEEIPLEDASVDTILSTFTLCTVSNLDAVLSEFSRLLKPEGKVLFLEHSILPKGLQHRLQVGLNPVWRTLADGCNIDRDPVAALNAAGFNVIVDGQKSMGGATWLLGQSLWGTATQEGSIR